MRRRRISDGETESTELLLDTIANLFGGVILIAVLVAILSGQQAHDLISQEESLEDVYAVIDLRGDRERLLQEIESSSARIQDLKEMKSSIADGSSAALDVIADDLLAELEAEESLVQRDEDRLRELRRIRSDASQIEATIEDEIADLMEQRTGLQEELEAAQAIMSPEARLPIRGRTTKPPITVLLKHNRLFPILGPGGIRLSDTLTYDLDPGVVLEVSGFSVANGIRVQDEAEWAVVFSRFPPASAYFQIGVCSDSFEAFMAFRTEIERLGYLNRIVPMYDASTVEFRGRDTGIVE